MSEERHILQVKCDRAAFDVSERIGHRCAVTVIGFYKQVTAQGWGFASSLPDAEAIVITLEAVVAGWCGATLPARTQSYWLPDEKQVRELGAWCRDQLPLSCGLILVFGAGVNTRYFSSEEDAQMSNYIAHWLIPCFKERLAEGAAQPTEPK